MKRLRNIWSNFTRPDSRNQDSGTRGPIQFYKTQVLDRPLAAEIYYQPKTSLDNFYVDVLIHTERARHEFSKDMGRREIYDVYMNVPETSIRLEKIKDIFYPNYDTKGKFPRSILAIGRPGTGKTVLTEKIIRDWASHIDEFYRDKIPIIFKIKLFNAAELNNISLKKFLQLGTRLDDDEFERIYEEITKEPERAILIFDSLQEFNGNPTHCLEASSIIPNDPNSIMSAMNFFVKLVQGSMLKGATVLVTSRATAEDFYSKLNFDRNIEILGFTDDKIEEYVTQFCHNNHRDDLKQKIWNYIKSNFGLLCLCYIPVNCFIICVTLLQCLRQSPVTPYTSAFATTLTNLYLRVIDHLGHATKETSMKLQSLAFDGLLNGQLVFPKELFDEQMRKSSLLNSLPNPYFPSEAQFCFTHLTIQEFLAARHVMTTFSPEKIKAFILVHVANYKWHLVLQFIAGLLGKKIEMFQTEQYKKCVLAFGESLKVTNASVILLSVYNVFIVKYLREVDNEEIVKYICETTCFNDVTSLRFDDSYVLLSASDMAAVIFVSKQLKNLTRLDLHFPPFSTGMSSELFEAFNNDNCSKLIELNLSGMHVVDVKILWGTLRLGLCKPTKLGLSYCRFINKCIPSLCNALQDERCQLTDLSLKGNAIGDKGASMLFENGLTKKHCKLTKLDLIGGWLTDQCIPSLCKALQDKRCRLTELSLNDNGIGDKGASMLFEYGLTHEHCKLRKLNLIGGSLTDQCIPSLCKALQDKRCPLTELSLEDNPIGDNGACMLFEDALRNEHCKLTELDLSNCSLTDKCIPSLLEALQDERCGLVDLDLESNTFTEDGKGLLSDAKEKDKKRGIVSFQDNTV